MSSWHSKSLLVDMLRMRLVLLNMLQSCSRGKVMHHLFSRFPPTACRRLLHPCRLQGLLTDMSAKSIDVVVYKQQKKGAVQLYTCANSVIALQSAFNANCDAVLQ